VSELATFALLLVAAIAIGGAWLVRGVLTHPRTDGGNANDPVVLAEAPDEMTAEILRSKIEAFGIRAFTRNRLGRTFPGAVPPMLLGWEVLVRRADAAEAEAIVGMEAHEPSTTTNL
jgi:hypothetical protein